MGCFQGSMLSQVFAISVTASKVQIAKSSLITVVATNYKAGDIRLNSCFWLSIFSFFKPVQSKQAFKTGLQKSNIYTHYIWKYHKISGVAHCTFQRVYILLHIEL